MGNAWFVSWMKKDVRILMIGLDAAGKTTILYHLKQLEEVVTTIPTIKFHVEAVEYANTRFKAWDVGGRWNVRPLYRHYYQNTDALVYVVDNADGPRLPETKEELSQLLGEENLEGIPLLVMANKQDLLETKTASEITKQLQLNKLKGRDWGVMATSAETSTQGLYESVEWLSHAIYNKRTAAQRTGSAKSTNERTIKGSDITGDKSTFGLYVDKSWTFIKKLFLMNVG